MAVQQHAHTMTAKSSSLLRLFLSLLLLCSAVVAQQETSFQFLPNGASSTFPQCGLSCTTLQQAQTLCVPPTAQGTQAILVGCFCQSALLTTLKTSGATVCPGCTSASDQQLLVTWYNTYCSSGGTVGGPSTTTTAATGTATTTGATGTATTTTTTAATATANSVNASSAPKSWISTHWQWVLMVIILIVGFSLLAVIGIWAKRRYDAKHSNLYHGDDSGVVKPSGALRARGGSLSRRSPAAGFFFSSGANSEASNGNGLQDAPPQARYHELSMSMSSANASNSALHWGPHAHHHRDDMDIAPVDDPGFVANSSRTDLSSLGGRDTPRTGPNRLSVHSGSRLYKQEPISHSPVSAIGPE